MTTKRKKKELKQSETKMVKRSSLTINPINPKRHTNEAVKLQCRNLQKVGFLGGIVINSLSGNIIDGHRRVYAMDDYYGYDGTKETDYDVKVEVTELDEKTEKEQLSYMAVGNTKPDLDLIADYIKDIDYTSIGLTDRELSDVLALAQPDIDTITNTLDVGVILPSDPIQQEPQKTHEERTEHMKRVKEQNKTNAIERQMADEAYLTLSFSSYQNKALFCSLIGVSDMDRYAKGEEVMKMIE